MQRGYRMPSTSWRNQQLFVVLCLCLAGSYVANAQNTTTAEPTTVATTTESTTAPTTVATTESTTAAATTESTTAAATTESTAEATTAGITTSTTAGAAEVAALGTGLPAWQIALIVLASISAGILLCGSLGVGIWALTRGAGLKTANTGRVNFQNENCGNMNRRDSMNCQGRRDCGGY